MLKRKNIPIVILVLLLVIVVTLAVIFVCRWLSKEKILKLKIEFIEKNEREVAFLQEGDIWVVDRDLKKKYKMLDTKEAITRFSFSPNGKEIYWLNETGELWKKEEGESALPLAGIAGKTEYEKYRVNIKEYKKDFLEICKETLESYQEYYEENVGKFDELGKIKYFELSPDGKHIVYEPLAGYTGCCGGIFNVPINWVWIMKSDGTERVEIEQPTGVRRPLIFFNSWLPDSRGILFYFSAPDEATQGSVFFEVGIDGKNPKVYTEIFKFFKGGIEVGVEDIDVGDLTVDIIGIEPIYSPLGERVAYIKEGSQIRLKDIKTKETKTILEEDYFPFGPASKVLKWSEDGSLLSVITNDKVVIFNEMGGVIFETGFDAGAVKIEEVVFSPDNQYLAGTYEKEWEKIDIIFFINFTTEEKKEFKLPEFEDIPERVNLYPKFFSKSNRLYYLIKIESEDTGIEQLFSQLWVIDTGTWENYEVVDNVSQVVKTP